MNLLSRAVGRRTPPERAVSFNGQLLQLSQSWGATSGDRMAHDFVSYVADGYRDNGVVFSVILARLLLFSEATFKFQRTDGGRPGELSGGPGLAALERPWPNGTTGDLLARMEQDVSLAGNSYTYRVGPGRLKRLRPDWVELLIGSMSDDPAGVHALDAEVLAYLYTPGGPGSGNKRKVLDRNDVAHYAPIPDPLAMARGMSWLTPVARECDADTSMTRHKGKFFEHAATPNMVVKTTNVLTPDERKRTRAMLRQRFEGVDNAYKTMLLEGGADVEVVGNTFEQISFTAVQAAGENRIAAAGGVPGIVVGLKEGLQAATYSNYEQAMRRFADLTMRPLWRNASGSLATIVDVPAASRLWYDDREIPALKQDAKQSAEILKSQADTIGALIRSGYEPDSVTRAVLAGDYSLLVHSGLRPVTLAVADVAADAADAT